MLSAKTRPPSLVERLKALIAAEGPISVENYMRICLLDAHEGAYAARAEFQRSGAGYALAEIKAHYRAKLQGKRTRKPKPRLWPR